MLYIAVKKAICHKRKNFIVCAYYCVYVAKKYDLTFKYTLILCNRRLEDTDKLLRQIVSGPEINVDVDICLIEIYFNYPTVLASKTNEISHNMDRLPGQSFNLGIFKFKVCPRLQTWRIRHIINFLRIGKKQKWQKIETDGLSLKQNIRNMLKFSIWGGPRWGAVCTFQLCICHSIYAEFDNFLNLMIIKYITKMSLTRSLVSIFWWLVTTDYVTEWL